MTTRKNIKTILVVGLTGSGKSTLCNSIINKSGKLRELTSPFNTSDGATGCTLQFQVNITPTETVLDTVGFGDPQFDPSQIFEQFKAALSRAGNKVTHVIFVVKKGRFTRELVNFFTSVQEKVLEGKCRNNSLVLFSDCEKWVEKQDDQYLKKAIANCNGVYYEYSLRFDRESDENEYKALNLKKRQEAVDKLLKFLNSHEFKEIDLSHVQSKEFEKNYNEKILPELIQIMNEMASRHASQMTQVIENFNKQMAVQNQMQNRVVDELKSQNVALIQQLQRQRSDSSSDDDDDRVPSSPPAKENEKKSGGCNILLCLRILLFGHHILYNKKAPKQLKDWLYKQVSDSGIITRSRTRGDYKMVYNGSKYGFITFQNFYGKLFNKLTHKEFNSKISEFKSDRLRSLSLVDSTINIAVQMKLDLDLQQLMVCFAKFEVD